MSFAWSYSSLTAFETCPHRWNLTKRLKQVTESQTEATLEGNRVHKALELYVKNGTPLPEGYQHLLPLASRVRGVQGGTIETERKVALTQGFSETTYFGKEVWLRVVYDVRVSLPTKSVILDWKTGKRKLDADQLKLFAATEFKLRPTIDTVDTGYVWLKDNKIDRETFQRSDAVEIWAEFSQRVGRITKAIETNNFPKRPSGLCRQWCPVGQRLCEHCGS